MSQSRLEMLSESEGFPLQLIEVTAFLSIRFYNYEFCLLSRCLKVNATMLEWVDSLPKVKGHPCIRSVQTWRSSRV